MPGAIRLAAEAALRSGAGLVEVATHCDSAPACSRAAEVICRPVEGAAELDALLELADGVVVGRPRHVRVGRAMWRRVAGSTLPLVVDADALNLLRNRPPRGVAGS